MAEKLDILRRATEEVKKNPKSTAALRTFNVRSEDKYFASSEGSSIQQLILQIYGNVDATATDRQAGVSRTAQLYSKRRRRQAGNTSRR